jgi:magnesium transporter
MALNAYYLTKANDLVKDLDEQGIEDALRSREGLLWIDVSDAGHEDGVFLARVFKFHSLAIDDCVSTVIHSPKIDDYGDYLFILAHEIDYSAVSQIVETIELNLFLGPNYVVSSHNFPVYSVDAVRQQVERDARPMSRGASFLAHALLDALAHNVVPAMDTISDQVDEIEEVAITSPQKTILKAVQSVKRSTQRIQRRIAPQKEVFARLGRREFALVSQDAAVFFRDLYDLAVWVEGINQTLHDRADHAVTTYMSSQINHQNETMRVLAIVATILLPLNLIASIYGMNFENMPELKWSWGYYGILGLIGAVLAGAFGWFWGWPWLKAGRKRVRLLGPLRFDLRKLRGFDVPGNRRKRA